MHAMRDLESRGRMVRPPDGYPLLVAQALAVEAQSVDVLRFDHDVDVAVEVLLALVGRRDRVLRGVLLDRRHHDHERVRRCVVDLPALAELQHEARLARLDELVLVRRHVQFDKLPLVQRLHALAVHLHDGAVVRRQDPEVVAAGAAAQGHGDEALAPRVRRRDVLDEVVAEALVARDVRALVAGHHRDRTRRVDARAGHVREVRDLQRLEALRERHGKRVLVVVLLALEREVAVLLGEAERHEDGGLRVNRDDADQGVLTRRERRDDVFRALYVDGQRQEGVRGVLLDVQSVDNDLVIRFDVDPFLLDLFKKKLKEYFSKRNVFQNTYNLGHNDTDLALLFEEASNIAVPCCGTIYLKKPNRQRRFDLLKGIYGRLRN